MDNQFTEKEALKKFCPFINKHCKGTYCMLFQYVGEEITNIYDEKKPLNPPETGIMKVYSCGANSIQGFVSNVEFTDGELECIYRPDEYQTEEGE